MPRTRRHARIADLLRSGAIASQEDLVEALSAEGETVTQATVSRDLAAIGAVKGPAGYVLPDGSNGTNGSSGSNGGAVLARAVREHAVSVVAAEALVVVKTAPGHAALLGVIIDRDAPPEVAGTVAGDDTIFIATDGRATAKRLARRFADFLDHV